MKLVGFGVLSLSEKKANNSHVKYITNRTITKERFKQLKKMLFN